MGRTAPRVPPDHSHHAGPHGIPLDVADGVEEIWLAQRTGKEAVLPKVPAAAVQFVDVARVEIVCAADALGQ